jgi:hypothetical protein
MVGVKLQKHGHGATLEILVTGFVGRPQPGRNFFWPTTTGGQKEGGGNKGEGRAAQGDVLMFEIWRSGGNLAGHKAFGE